jgi:hypothetical protein
LSALLRERLAEVDDATGKTYAQLVVEGWIAASMAGSVPAIKELLDRTEGKVADKVQVDDPRKAYVTESPDTLWPDSNPNSAPTSPTEPPERFGETPAPSCSSAVPPAPVRAARASKSSTRVCSDGQAPAPSSSAKRARA